MPPKPKKSKQQAEREEDALLAQLAAVSAPPPRRPPPPPKPTPAEQKAAGNAAYQEGDYVTAVQCFQSALAEMGVEKLVFSSLPDCNGVPDNIMNIMLGEHDGLGDEIKKVRRVQDGIPAENYKLTLVCQSNLAQAFIALHQYEEAFQALRAAQALIKAFPHRIGDCDTVTDKVMARYIVCCARTRRYEEGIRNLAPGSAGDYSDLVDGALKESVVGTATAVKVLTKQRMLRRCYDAWVAWGPDTLLSFGGQYDANGHHIASDPVSVSVAEGGRVAAVALTPPLPPMRHPCIVCCADRVVLVDLKHNEVRVPLAESGVFVLHRDTLRTQELAGPQCSETAVVVADDTLVYIVDWRDSASMGTIHSVDPVRGTYSLLTRIPYSQERKKTATVGACWIHDGRAYMFGGTTDLERYTNELWTVRVDTGRFERIVPLGLVPMGRGEVKAVKVPDTWNVVMMGGFGELRYYGAPYFGTGLLYSMKTRLFTTLCLPGMSPRAYVSPVVMPDGALYACGGYVGNNATGGFDPLCEILQIRISKTNATSLHEFEHRFPVIGGGSPGGFRVVGNIADLTNSDLTKPREKTKKAKAPPPPETPKNTTEIENRHRYERGCPIRINPQDSGAFSLPSHFFEDPAKFAPVTDRGTLGGRPRRYMWAGAAQNGDIVSHQMRRMSTALLYGPLCPDAAFEFTPEVQWLKLYGVGPTPMPAPPISLVLRIEMVNLTSGNIIGMYKAFPIHRTFTCPATLTLDTFAHRVLTPVMGWGIQQHAHYYTHLDTGALLGPQESDALDYKMWHASHGHHWLDESAYRVCDVLGDVGQECLYVYDLGDVWAHLITVERVIHTGEAQGAIVIDGAMNCPPEDITQRYLIAIKSSQVKSIAMEECGTEAAAAVVGGGAHRFDPMHFDIEERNAAVRAAFRQSGYRGTGTSCVHTIFPGHTDINILDDEVDDDPPEIAEMKARGKRVVKTEGERRSYTVMGAADESEDVTRLCSSCGRPENKQEGGSSALEECVRCGRCRYCSHECALADKARHLTDEKCGGHNWAEVFARRARVEGVTEEVKKSHQKKKKKTVVKEDEAQACVVCMTEQRRWVAQPCGHGIYCIDCYATHEAKEPKNLMASRRLKACPLCRVDITGWIKVFL